MQKPKKTKKFNHDLNSYTAFSIDDEASEINDFVFDEPEVVADTES